MGSRQRGDKGAQQLGFAAAGRTNAQSVRAHTAVGRFLEIHRDGLARRIDTNGHHETRRPLPAMPHATGR